MAGQRGVTLVETVAAIAVSSIILVALTAFQVGIFSLNRSLQSSLTIQHDARQALKVLTAELRSASPSATGAYPIADAQGTTLTFYSDADDDGRAERLRYFVEGAALKKGTLKPVGNPPVYVPAEEVVTTLVSDLDPPAATLFTYYDAAYDGTTAPLPAPVRAEDVRLVKITFVVDRDQTRPPAPLTLTTQVSVRNVKDNL